MIPATAFQLHDTYAYKDHAHIHSWKCTYRYILHIITFSSSLSIRALSFCFSLLRCSVCVCLLVICMIWFLCCLVSLFHMTIVSNITQVLSSQLASFLSISTIHHSILVTVLALLLVSILDFIAALSKKQLVNGRKPHIYRVCTLSYCPVTMFCNHVFGWEGKGTRLVLSINLILVLCGHLSY